MSGPVNGATNSQKISYPQDSTNTTVVREGQTLDDIARDRGVSKQALLDLNPQAARGVRPGQELRLPDAHDLRGDAGERPGGRSSSTSRSRGKAIDLNPQTSRNSVDLLLRKSPSQVMQAQANVSVDAGPQSIDQDFALGLARKSPEELKAWYQNSTDAMKAKLKSVIWKMDRRSSRRASVRT